MAGLALAQTDPGPAAGWKGAAVLVEESAVAGKGLAAGCAGPVVVRQGAAGFAAALAAAWVALEFLG